MITMEALKTRYEDELKDAELYKEMAEKCDNYRQIFLDISKEESLHAEHIKFIMDHMK